MTMNEHRVLDLGDLAPYTELVIFGVRFSKEVLRDVLDRSDYRTLGPYYISKSGDHLVIDTHAWNGGTRSDGL